MTETATSIPTNGRIDDELLRWVVPPVGEKGPRNVDVETRVRDIDPETAAAWLTRHIRNRPIDATHVALLAVEMRNGRWKLNGESIKFDWYGRLRDGRHRLTAVIESGATIRSCVTKGIDPAVFETLDQGKKRTISDNLALIDEPSHSILAVGLAELARYVRGDFWATAQRYRHVTPGEALRTLRAHPEIRDSLEPARAVRGVASPGLFTFFHYAFSQKDPSLATSFVSRLGDGTGLMGDEPVYHLRERLLKARYNKNYRMRPTMARALVIKSWNKTRAGEAVGRLRWDDREDFPAIA